MATWTMDPETFAALWYSDANDRFPPPLKYLSRFRHEDDFARFRDQVRAGYDRDEREAIEFAMHVLSKSRLRIEILGCTIKHRTSTGPEDAKEYRILGTADHQRSVVAFQGGRADEYGDITLHLLAPDSLPAQLVRSIPDCRPGREPTATFHPQDLDTERNANARTTAGRSPREQYERLLGRRGDGYGIARLYLGPLYTRPDPFRTVRWFDVTADGRYTETRGNHVTVRPTTRDDLTGRFAAWFETADKRLRESEPAW
ncbi:ESX secretion-associated protein EspG [Nocardia carnea]|uniref:ESX secretion-associated protein EspG n=1 Tax=Nocardia carnea TaxID=37328 RepID=A0ABW7TZE8_9NOCA|nr:ESX secretion-associated protein EspG [Nocardia carnea]